MQFIESLKNFFSKEYLFSAVAPSDFLSLLPMMIAFGGSIVLAVILMIIFRKADPITGKIKEKINTWLISFGIFGFLIIFFRWQNLGFLSKNIVLIIFATFWLVWLATIVLYIFRKYPKEAFVYNEKHRIKKYLPSRRK